MAKRHQEFWQSSASTSSAIALLETKNRTSTWMCNTLFHYTDVQRMKLSVVMPVYNERTTLRQVVERVLAVPLEIELICVDDGSRDGSKEILAQLQAEHPQVRIFLH
jgi:cellulose synthase/poly-beta-1,6-N-acetylglucosamine synthase-like glycosyltransferase